MAHEGSGLTKPVLDSVRPSFSDILAALPVAAIAVDADGCIAFANAAAEVMLNRSERTMLGQRFDTIVPMPIAHEARTDGTGVAAFDTSISLAGGPTLRVDYAEVEVPDHPGWRVATLHPGPMRRHGDARGSARAAVAAAAMLAHEIKNPLSGIRGAAQLLGSGQTDPDDVALTDLIVTEVDRIAGLIDRMQDLSDTRSLAPVPTNIYPLLDHARRVARAGFAQAITIEERFDPSLPLAFVDPDALLQILLNLLKNASEALESHPSPRITLTTAYRAGVSTARPGSARRALPIELCVIDNGPGAPADLADALFDAFVSTRREGRGLGLALVGKLVGDMGGMVSYAREGTPAHTVFRLLLPRGGA